MDNNDELMEKTMNKLTKILNSDNILGPSIDDEEDFLDLIDEIKYNCKNNNNCTSYKKYQVFSVNIMDEFATKLADYNHALWILDFEDEVKCKLI